MSKSLLEHFMDRMISYVLGRYLLSLDWGTPRWIAWGVETFPSSRIGATDETR